MDEILRARLQSEARKRAKLKAQEEQLNFVNNLKVDFNEWLRERTHEKQFNFLTDPESYKCAYTSRQSGKTKGIAYALTLEPLLYRHIDGEPSVFAYVSLTKASARSIIWEDLLRTIQKEKLSDYIQNIDNTRNIITYKNGNIIRLFGAKDSTDAERLRGLRVRRVYIDEAQSFRDRILRYLVDEVLGMGLIANNGKIVMTGTPNAQCAGYFYNACHNINENDEEVNAWSVHTWNVFDNHFLERNLQQEGSSVKAFLNKLYTKRGVSETDPAYKREALGLWIKTLDFLMYRYNSVINSHDFQSYEHEYLFREAKLDEDTGEKIDLVLKSKRYVLPNRKEWHYVLGMDFGFGDDCAWVIYAFNKDDNSVYIVETINEAGIIPSLAAEITKELNEHYKFYKIVGDTGGIGKSYTEEMKHRFNLIVNSAEKSQKSAYIKLMNDDFRMGRIKADKTSDIVEEWSKNVWEVVGVREKEKQDNHLSDAALYGWRECRHYALYEAPKKEPAKGSDEYYKQIEEELEEMDDNEFNKKNSSNWWEN